MALNLYGASAWDLVECLPHILNHSTAQDIVDAFNNNPLRGPHDLEVLTGTPVQEWIRLMDEGIIRISPSMDTIGKIGQIPKDHVPTSSSHTDLVSKQEGVAPDKYSSREGTPLSRNEPFTFSSGEETNVLRPSWRSSKPSQAERDPKEPFSRILEAHPRGDIYNQSTPKRDMPIITEPPKSQSIFHRHSALKDPSKDYHNWSTPSRTVYPHHRDYTTGTHQSTLEVGGARSSTFRDSYPPESHTGSPGFTPVTRESYDSSFYRASKIDSPEVPITQYGRTNSTDQEHRITRDYPLNPTQRTPSSDKVIPTRQSSKVKGHRHDDSNRHHRRPHRSNDSGEHQQRRRRHARHRSPSTDSESRSPPRSSRRHRRCDSSSSSGSRGHSPGYDSDGYSTSSSASSDNRHHHRRRKKSPQSPKLTVYTGDKSWRTFLFQFERYAHRYRWSDRKKAQRLVDCLGGQVLEYVRQLKIEGDFKVLKAKLTRRFGVKDAPITVRRTLQFLKQGDSETLEEFSQRIQFNVMDGFPGAKEETIEQLSVEHFLKGCIDKRAASVAMDKNPKYLHRAVKAVKDAVNNRKAIYGKSTTQSLRKVTFADTEGHHTDEGYSYEQGMYEVKSANVASSPAASKSTEQNSSPHALVKDMKEMKERMEGLESMMKTMMKRFQSRSATPSPQRSPQRPESSICYSCKKKGHFQKDCPVSHKSEPVARVVSVGRDPISCHRDQSLPQQGDGYGYTSTQTISTEDNQLITIPSENEYENSHSDYQEEPSVLTSKGGDNQDEIVVRHCQGLSLVVPVKINGVDTTAVIDSAAQVTIINKQLLEELPDTPTVTGQVKLRGIGKQNATLPAFKITGINIKFGQKEYPWDIYVAEMADSLLLGLDFLVAKQCKVDFMNNTVDLPGETIVAALRQGFEGELCSVFKVVSTKRTTVPPNMRIRLPVKVCQQDHEDKDFIIEPKCDQLKGLVASHSIVSSSGYIDVISDTDVSVTIKNDQAVGTAIEIDEVITPEVSHEQPAVRSLGVSSEVSTVAAMLSTVPASEVGSHGGMLEVTDGKTTSSKLQKVTDSLPEHLVTLFQDTNEGQPEEHLIQIGALLKDYADVFASHDLDLGCLSKVKHKIDTKDAPPVRQRIRRTPLGFEDEERKHLDKMIDAGVIRPSESDWASAPVLVRKKDGSVRWCIDYRALNERTVKDQYPLPLIEDCLDTLSGTQYFSTLDMASGYYQIQLDDEAIKKTAFITK